MILDYIYTLARRHTAHLKVMHIENIIYISSTYVQEKPIFAELDSMFSDIISVLLRNLSYLIKLGIWIIFSLKLQIILGSYSRFKNFIFIIIIIIIVLSSKITLSTLDALSKIERNVSRIVHQIRLCIEHVWRRIFQ